MLEDIWRNISAELCESQDFCDLWYISAAKVGHVEPQPCCCGANARSSPRRQGGLTPQQMVQSGTSSGACPSGAGVVGWVSVMWNRAETKRSVRARAKRCPVLILDMGR